MSNPKEKCENENVTVRKDSANPARALILALLVMFLWGSIFPSVKLGYKAYGIVTLGDTLYFAGVRFTICGAIICLYSLIREKQNFRAVKGAILPILLSGLFAIILHYSFLYTGLQLTDSSKSAILKQVGPLFYVCFSFLFFKDDKLTVRKLVGAILGFAGIIAINTSADGVAFQVGDALVIGASFCTVFSNVVSKKLFQKVEPITATGCSQLFGGMILLSAGKVSGGQMSFTFDSSAWIFGYICLASIFGYCIWFMIVKKGELSKLFIVKFAEPVFAAVCGAFLLGEDIFKVQYLAAFVLIALGIYVSQRKK